MRFLTTIRKALMAAGFASAAALGAAMLDGDLTRPEGIVAAGMGLLAGGAVYNTRNAGFTYEPHDKDPAFVRGRWI